MAGVRRRILVEQDSDRRVHVKLPPIPVACRLVLPSGRSVEVAPFDSVRQVILA